jgi:chromosomal replication initiation ATPase DnaA
MEIYLTSDVMLSDFDADSQVSIEYIARLCSNYFKVDLQDILRDNRFTPVKKARHFICYFGIKHRFTSVEIGAFLNKCHSSVLYGNTVISDEIERYDDSLRAFRWIDRRLN